MDDQWAVQDPNGGRARRTFSLTIGNHRVGLLGPNGAGRRSLMRTIATLQDLDEGSIALAGWGVLRRKSDVHSVLGGRPQEFGVCPSVSALGMPQAHPTASSPAAVRETQRCTRPASFHARSASDTRRHRR